jgi:hypothetical protein
LPAAADHNLGQKLCGVYEDVTPETEKRILDVLRVHREALPMVLQAQKQARLIRRRPRA